MITETLRYLRVCLLEVLDCIYCVTVCNPVETRCNEKRFRLIMFADSIALDESGYVVPEKITPLRGLYTRASSGISDN